MNIEALIAPAIPADDKPCLIGQAIAALDGKNKATVIKLIATSHSQGGLSDDELSARFRAAGMPGRKTSINRHRRGTCGCGTHFNQEDTK